MRIRRTGLVLAATLVLLVAGQAMAYTIHLKDGSTVVAREKYKVVDGKAVIILMNGTETFVPVANIDVAKTERANQQNYGSAVVIETAPSPESQAAASPQQSRLSDLIANRGTDARTAVPATGKPAAAVDTAARTRSGDPDLAKAARRPVLDADLGTELLSFLRAQGIVEVELFQGTQTDRLLVEITTNSEASVFRALTVAANALLNLNGGPGRKVAAFELLMATPSRERAGQFLLTPAMAADLVAKRVEVSAFFVDNVQF